MYEQHILVSSQTFSTGAEVKLPPVNILRQSNVYSNPGAKFYLSVSAVTGTPAADVKIFKTIRGIDYQLAAFVVVSAAGKQFIDISNCPDEVFVSVEVPGAASTATLEVHMSR